MAVIEYHTPLARIVHERGLSLRGVAKAVGYHHGHLARVASGMRNSSPELADSLARFLGNAITRDQILFPKDYPEPVTSPKKRTLQPKGRAA